MAQLQIYEQKDFTGGLNLRSDQFQLADNESPEMLNVEVDPRGGVFTRGGMRRFNATNVSGTWSPQKLTAFYGDQNYLVLANHSRVAAFNQMSSTFDNIQYSGSDIVSDGPHGACVAPWGNTLYIATGTDGTSTHAYSWNGSVSTQIHGIDVGGDWNASARFPRSEHIIVHANKMFAAAVKVEGVYYPNRIYWSNEDLPEKWSKDDWFEVTGGGPSITGMCVVNGVLVVFKQYAIYAIYGYDSSDFRIVEISTSIGCHSHDAMAQTENGVYFYATHKGLHFFDGTQIIDLFEPIRPAFDLHYINSSSPESVSVSWIGRRVWLSLPYITGGTIATTPTLNIIFDPSMRSYSVFKTADNSGVVGGCDWRNGAGTEHRLMCHPIIPVVLDVDCYDISYDIIGEDNSHSGFDSVYRTKWFDGGSYMQRKMFRRPDLVLRETQTVQSINVDVFHNYQEADGSEARTFVLTQSPTASGALWDDNNWAFEPVGEDAYGSVWAPDVLGGAIQTAKNLGMCKAVQLRFSGGQKKPWGINSIGYKWSPRRVKG